MIYGAVLAGGTGRRFKSSTIPKQFITIDGIPIIILTMRPILKNKRINEIYVAVNKEWMEYTKDLFKKFFLEDDLKRIVILDGGQERIDSFLNIMYHIVLHKGIHSDDIIIYHDSVRPLTPDETVYDCIEQTLINKLSTVVKPVTYTVLLSKDGTFLEESLDRTSLFEIHTPSGFNLELLYNECIKADKQLLRKVTCTSQLMVMLGHKVKTIVARAGDFKITTESDLDFATNLYKNNNQNNI
ncbi:MAG: 2-C-methyl-D-erythritol 4-phosphate cytidylyltransferase [Clostridia bacterium]|nr:2-C-methyl-D-erythritol 4-phosphate cytidylyltransferase [Clostridia bacterium]